MKQTVWSLLKGTCVGAMLVVLTGCCSTFGHQHATTSTAPTAQATTTRGCPVVTREGDMMVAKMALPTHVLNTSDILLERTLPIEARVGETIEYTVKVTNLTDCPLEDVAVTERLPDGFKLVSSSPQAATDGSKAK